MEENVTNEEMEVMEESNKEAIDYGPNVDLEHFAFLSNIHQEDVYLHSKFDTMRPMKALLGFLDNPHGSVKLYQGDTCVICAVYGPSDIRMAKEQPHRAAVDVLYRPKITGSSIAAQLTQSDPNMGERAIENIICSIFESSIYLEDHLLCGFNIILHEFEDDGCLLAACINAASLALMNAGCSIRFPVAAVSVVISKEGHLIIDPSAEQTEDCIGDITFAFNNAGALLFTKSTGRISVKVYKSALFYALKASKDIFRFWKLVQDYETSCFQQQDDGGASDIVKTEISDDVDIKPLVPEYSEVENDEDMTESLNEVS